MTFQKRISTAIAAGALVLNLATPAFAATDIEISGNAQNSTNNASVVITHQNAVVQNNTAVVINKVDADADTGDNDANGNNGGNVTITTGNAKTSANVTNDLNRNAASIDCCPANGNTTVSIKDNAQNTTNNLGVVQTSNNTIAQSNNAFVLNKVDAEADTGDNDANGNNGGSVTIHTGNASSTANVTTIANRNAASIGGGGGLGSGNSSLNLTISGNGQNSTNNLGAAIVSGNTIQQGNSAKVINIVDADADTGDNDANGNNGNMGDVTITTGNATANATVWNDVNFNWADASCGCLLGKVDVKVGGNAQDSTNNLGAVISDTGLLAFQGNNAVLKNILSGYNGADADTGDNEANGNNSGSADPTIHTGDADANAKATNTGNVNIVGGPMPSVPPITVGSAGNFNFTINFAGLLAWLWGV